MNQRIPRIILTPGEPAGVGPDLVIELAQQAWPAQLVVFADPLLLEERARLLERPIKLIPYNDTATAIPGALSMIPVEMHAHCQPGILNKKNAAYVLKCLEMATDFCLDKKADALVTGPVHKGVMNDAGIAFTGHTEFLASHCQRAHVIMLFVTPTMKVALATTHLPLSQVPSAITESNLIELFCLLAEELKHRFGIPSPRIAVTGLNPHAGEGGHLGTEERDIIEPALKKCRAQGIDVLGPFPADTIFTQKQVQYADVIVAMYHDQALPVVKYQGFGHAVNITLGLPIIRTSVDHGTALELAGKNVADASSFKNALEWAIRLSMESVNQ